MPKRATAPPPSLGVQYPIVQGPFGGGLSTALLTASGVELGGLGSFGAHRLPPDEIGALVREINAHTSRPFAMNLWVSNRDPGALRSRRSISMRRSHCSSRTIASSG